MKSGRVSPADAAKTLVAFANADGGRLLVGIHDGEVDGVSPARANEAHHNPRCSWGLNPPVSSSDLVM